MGLGTGGMGFAQRSISVIKEWKQAWRLYSVQLAGVLVALDVLNDHLPMMHAYLPDAWVRWFALAIILGRVIRQSTAKQEATE